MRLLLFLVLFSTYANSQDISGAWAGTIESKGSSFPYEVFIYKEKEKWKGYALINFQIDGKDNPGIKEIELKFKKNNFILEDDKLIYESFHSTSRRSKLYAVLSLKNDSINILQGSFSTRSLDMRAPETYSGKMTLIKQATVTPLLLLTHLTDLQLSQSIVSLNTNGVTTGDKNENSLGENQNSIKKKESKASTSKITDSDSFMPKSITTLNEVASVHNRKTEIVNEFEIDADSVTLTLYDNGEIDGDVVSVFANGQLVLSKQKLTANQSRITVSLSAFKTNAIDIVMFAESLGTIPPNTGLLILEYGSQKKEIRFACDLKKNAGILLKRKKKD